MLLIFLVELTSVQSNAINILDNANIIQSNAINILGSANIIQSNAINILGITHGDDLSWDTHAKHVQLMVNSIIEVLQRFFSSLKTDAQLKIHNVFILDLKCTMNSYYHALPTVSLYGEMDQHLLHLNLTVVTYPPYALY